MCKNGSVFYKHILLDENSFIPVKPIFVLRIYIETIITDSVSKKLNTRVAFFLRIKEVHAISIPICCQIILAAQCVSFLDNSQNAITWNDIGL